MNPYRRAERIATITGQVVVILAALTLLGFFFYYYVGFRWFCAAIVAWVAIMVAGGELVSRWTAARDAWDESHKEQAK